MPCEDIFGIAVAVCAVLIARPGAIPGCETCQAGNRAALSNFSGMCRRQAWLELPCCKTYIEFIRAGMCGFIACHNTRTGLEYVSGVI